MEKIYVLDAFVRARHRDGVSVECGPPAKRIGAEVLLDVRAHRHHRDRLKGRRETLCRRDDVGQQTGIVLEAPQLAGPTEAAHDLIGDVEHAILVA